MSINWGQSLTDWEPSVKAVEVTDQDTKDVLISFLELVGASELEPEIGHCGKWMRTFTEMNKCGFNDYTLMTEAARQLREHMRLWETHPDEAENVAYEFPIAVKISDILYYFKTIIFIKTELKKDEFFNIKKIKLSFHLNDNGTKAIKT